MGECEVVVMDGATLVQRRVCSRTTMPDGLPGVLWRGVAYPLQSGDRINIGVPAPSEPAACHAVIPGDEASWILIQGMQAGLDTARKTLERNGIVVSRTGRWLGDPVGQVAFDWFLRCEGRLDDQRVAGLLGQSGPVSVEADSAARLAVLEQRIASLLADVARAEGGLRRSMEAPRPAPEVEDPPRADSRMEPDPDAAMQSALAEIQALRSALEAMGADHDKKARPELAAPQTVRTHDEVAALLSALRPDILLIRDSLLVALGEFHARSGFYKAISELPLAGGRPDGWKMLRGTERWWERHLSTGRNDHGRAYARYNPASRQWSLLLGWKVDQPQDIAWLKRQG
jgi:hypothetical protein